MKDFLVPPHARNVVVDVYCVEEGRWDDGKGYFAPSEKMLDQTLRGKVLRKEGQSEVWNGIRDQEEKSGIPAKDHNLLEHYSYTQRNDKLDRRMHKIRRGIPHDAVGMVITKKNRILGIEAFINHDIFTREFNKLFRSYYYTDVPGWFYTSVNASDVRRLLHRLPKSSVYRDTGYRGSGRLYDVSTGGFYGSALDFGGILHLSLIK